MNKKYHFLVKKTYFSPSVDLFPASEVLMLIPILIFITPAVILHVQTRT